MTGSEAKAKRSVPTFKGNTAYKKTQSMSGTPSSKGGAIFSDSTSTISLSSTHFESNEAETGGAIATAGKALMTNVTLILNKGVVGSAVFNLGLLKMHGGLIADNSLGPRPPKITITNETGDYSTTGCTNDNPCRVGGGLCSSDSGCFSSASCEYYSVLVEKGFSNVVPIDQHTSSRFCYLPNAGALAMNSRDIMYMHDIQFSGNSPWRQPHRSQRNVLCECSDRHSSVYPK